MPKRGEQIDFSRCTALYRLFDLEGRLLYVGIAFDPEARWLAHAAEKAWWSEVAETRVQWLQSRTDALIAEVVAIKAERPLYNIVAVDEPVLTHVMLRPGVTPTRIVRIDDEMWAAFDEVCKDKGTSRADEIRRFVHAQVKAFRAEQRRIAQDKPSA